MKLLILFPIRNRYATFLCCIAWKLSQVKATKERVLLKEPDRDWKLWNTNKNWNLESNYYSVCGVGQSLSSDLLVSPFIKPPPTVKNVQVTAKYNVRRCDSFSDPPPKCQTKVEFLMKEQDLRSPFPSNPDQYDLLKRETPDKANLTANTPGNVPPKITSVLSANIQKKGVYFAIYVRSVCIVLFEFKVSYGICESEGINLMTFPETISPPASSQSINVTGACVKHAVSSEKQFSTPYAFCGSNSYWTTDASVYCVCKAGYQPKVILNTCEVTPTKDSSPKLCPSNTFKKEDGLESCIGCPLHSSQKTSPTGCICDEGYYRNNKEDVYYNCTSIPSAPIDVKTLFINASATILQWKQPKDTGGRTDLFYEIQCSLRGQLPCSSNIRYHPGNTDLKQTSVVISNLNAFTSYKFLVVSKNGVSEVAGKPNFAQIEVNTSERAPGIPTGVRVTRGKDLTTAHVEWTLEKPNGKILFYEVSYYNVDSGSRRKVNSSYTNITIHGLDPGSDYRFQIRAYTSKGYGQSSEEVGLKKEGLSSGSVIIIAIVIVVVAVVAVVVVVIVCLRRRSEALGGRGMEMLPSYTDGQREYIDPSSYGNMLAALTKFASEISRNYVELQDVIGGGEFGEVHKGKLILPDKQSEVVAVKILRSDASLKSRDDFLSEAAVMGQFSHSNVIHMKGVVTKTPPMMIILEFMENGSLDKFLTKNNGQLTHLQLIGMARGVASGMEYLANMNFIHRDLAARNILVADNLACKVADFGLSRELEHDKPDSEYMTQGGKIAVRWTALEAIKYRKFSSASDVWSYGILLWEIMTFGERPYWEWTNFQVMDKVENGYRLPSPVNCPKVIYNIMIDCWIEDKTRRPKFGDIVKLLDELIRSPDLLRDDMSSRVNKNNVINYESIETVEALLNSINMGKYCNNFTKAGYVNLGHLMDFGDEDLDKVGVKLLGHRHKIKKTVKGLKDHLAPTSAAPL